MRRICVVALLASSVLSSRPARAGLPESAPTAVGFDADRLKRIDAAIDRAIEHHDVPGVVVMIGRRGSIAYARAAGLRAVEPKSEPMTRDTVFDMASLTKPIATATSVMILIEEGKLHLDDRLTRVLPEFDNHGKSPITVDQLLRHRAGFIPDNPLADYKNGPETAWKRIAELELVSRPGERFSYSDVGFIVLGKVVEQKSGRDLGTFARERIFEPLAMMDAHFRPLNSSASFPVPIDRIAPTEHESPNGPMLRGAVHDPRSRAVGGIAGHAGLFATADDLAIFGQTLLNGGIGPNGRRILSPLAVRALIDPGSTPPGQRRGLGWDVQTGYSGPRGALFGPTSFGHTGFTGTSLWIDPETETFVIILTSRLHPDGRGRSPGALRADIATLAAAAITDACPRPIVASPTPPTPESDTHVAAKAPAAPAQSVRCGIDVLVAEDFAPLRGLKIGLVTNHTGRSRDGKSTIDVLFHASRVTLVKLFSPEHGIRGEVDAAVANSKDDATGLPIISLYGKDRKPRVEDLGGLDALVYDIQDIGARYYTYISTLGLVLEAAKESGKKVFVLDRPNAIGGLAVAGPVRDEEFSSFIAYHAVPVRHGMTVGELALLYNSERKIGAALEVVKCRGWKREELYDRTGLVWTNPSPNMRSLTEALLYPGVGLLEATNLATGRGTDTPFERIGAPWIDPVPFAAALNASNVPGVRFVPLYFTPNERQYAGKKCGGVQILVANWAEFEPLRLGMTLAAALRSQYPKDWQPEGLLRLLCDRATYQKILDRQPVDAIMAGWAQELAEFQKIRSHYLLYD
jgi:uncharacterized protein YbbC (DUF1343 family)/CubicO group peptidase (beta-lactamase class C family)